MAMIKKTGSDECQRGCGGLGTLTHCWWEHEMVPLLRETVWQFLRMLH